MPLILDDLRGGTNMAVVQVNGVFSVISGPLPPGEVEGWVTTFGGGNAYGRSVWFEAHPIGIEQGLQRLEVRNIAFNVSGSPSITCEVINTGTVATWYGLRTFWTDPQV
jgi:hypothetical protein